ncbi:MAG: CAP domain-containing protein, partial [Ilumatobacter sp.]|nr:CAP domain-containing protein [Ilumatobacter sp.]
PTTAPTPAPTAAEQAVLDRTNAERSQRSLAPLAYHPDLAAAAEMHGLDQRHKPCGNGSLSHTGTDGSNTGDRIARTGLRVRTWAENIACNFETAEAVVAAWMASPGHRANILNPRMTHLGVSLTRSSADGSAYWVQVFAQPS